MELGFVSTFGLNKTALRAPAAESRVVRRRVAVRSTLGAVKSESVPFLRKSAACDGTLGAADVGFDPLYLGESMDINWLREAEIKHGRISMLACLGFLVQEFWHLPGDVFNNPIAVDAFNQVPTTGLWHIFILCGVIEFASYRGKIFPYDMFDGTGHKPGNFGFDPLRFGKSEKAFKHNQACEIVHGRLAMIAIGGFIHQEWLFKEAVVQQLLNFQSIPQYF